MKYSVALSGSYGGRHMEDLFKKLSMEGIMQMSLVGREITLQVGSDNLEEIKKHLGNVGINNITVLEWKKAGMTLSDSGCGMDNNEVLKVSLIPSVKGGGVRQLALLCEFEVDREVVEGISLRIEEILEDAGVTEALYTVHIIKKAEEDEYVTSAAMATLNAIFDSGGVVNVD
jgi:hypothetical protein